MFLLFELLKNCFRQTQRSILQGADLWSWSNTLKNCKQNFIQSAELHTAEAKHICYKVFCSAGIKIFIISQDSAPMFKISVWIFICDTEVSDKKRKLTWIDTHMNIPGTQFLCKHPFPGFAWYLWDPLLFTRFIFKCCKLLLEFQPQILISKIQSFWKLSTTTSQPCYVIFSPQDLSDIKGIYF